MPSFNGPENPFDLEALRARPLADIPLTREVNTVPVRRPGRNVFFRVHDDPEFQVDVHVLEHDSEKERATYWVAPSLRDELAGELYAVRLFTCMSKHGTVFVWPVKLPQGGPGDTWHPSALEAANEAMRWWLKITGERDLGAYVFTKAVADFGAPQWPEWSFQQVLELAFKDHIITTAEHHVIREIRGYE
jgi:hypothetical protein